MVNRVDGFDRRDGAEYDDGGVSRTLASVPGFMPPAWWPAASNPTVQVTSAADAFPDIALQGNLFFVLVYFVVGLVFNIFGEEIYYRGFMMPKMRGVFGSWDWVANGILFTTYKILTGSMFRNIYKHLNGKFTAPSMELKSRNGFLSAADKLKLDSIIE